MNSIYILIALIFGVGIGSIVSFIVTRKILSDIRNNELDNYEFIKRWSEITDKQYADTRDYTGKLIDLFKQQVDILIDTDSKLLEAVKGMATAVDSSIKTRFDAFTENRLDVYDVLREDIDSMQTTSDNRWEIIKDYFVDRRQEDCLKALLTLINAGNSDITITPSWDSGMFLVEMYSQGKSVEQTFDMYRYGSDEEATEAFLKLARDMHESLDALIFKNKGGTTNEHEEMAAGTGAPEGGDAGHQEAEQDAVLPGEADGKLVQSELAEDRLGNPPEAEEGQGLDVSVLHAAVDAKLFSMDVAYDYNQH